MVRGLRSHEGLRDLQSETGCDRSPTHRMFLSPSLHKPASG